METCPPLQGKKGTWVTSATSLRVTGGSNVPPPTPIHALTLGTCECDLGNSHCRCNHVKMKINLKICFYFGCAVQLSGCQFPNQGSNLGHNSENIES